MKRPDQYEDSAKMEFWSIAAMVIIAIILMIFNSK